MSKDNKNTGNNAGLSDTDNLKLRMLKAKALLPKNMDYVPMYEHDKGVSMKTEDKMKLRRTWNLIGMDQDFVIWFEMMAEKLKVS